MQSAIVYTAKLTFWSDPLAGILRTLSGNPVIIYINVSGDLHLNVHAESASISVRKDEREEHSNGEDVPPSPVTPRRAGLHSSAEGTTQAVEASPATSITEPDSQALPYQAGSQIYLAPGPTLPFNAVRFENHSLEDSSSNKRRKYEHD
ncbi:hypothetical protein CVT26_015188 [Gymnopilus dilepis]|uniref:Uncharacterized protein n=1 Tax=Gymnopilus dilepis TaxID=231916 RepID=A0A409WA12_9AGAR|nr:hypothetical protein CVT26_015188 [Gymnopilus dilepis]